jgi:hypothetical protein
MGVGHDFEVHPDVTLLVLNSTISERRPSEVLRLHSECRYVMQGPEHLWHYVLQNPRKLNKTELNNMAAVRHTRL